jgi:hypothetical protein
MVMQSSILVRSHELMQEDPDELAPKDVPAIKVRLSLAIHDDATGEQEIEKFMNHTTS